MRIAAIFSRRDEGDRVMVSSRKWKRNRCDLCWLGFVDFD